MSLYIQSNIACMDEMDSTAPALCPSRLPDGAPGDAWRARIEHGKGAKARMLGKKPVDAFPVAVDYRCRDDKVTKSFTFFESAEDLFRQTAEMEQKNFYELIEPGRWTKLYLDIEHYVDACAANVAAGLVRIDEAVAVIKEVLTYHWRGEFETTGGALDDVVVLTASRHVEAAAQRKYKHSYHVIFPQIYFDGNTGLMKSLVQSLQNEPRLQALGKRGEPVCMLDGNVYHTDQPFRLVESCKLVDGKPIGVLRPPHRERPMTMAELLRTVVTHDGGGGVRIGQESIRQMHTVITSKKRPPSAFEAESCRRTNKHMKTTQALPAECVKEFEELLVQAGVQQCCVAGVVLEKKDRVVLPLRNTGPRPCILSRGESHKSNNAFLVVSDGMVLFKCQSGKCQGKSKCLGVPPRSWLGMRSAAPPVDADGDAVQAPTNAGGGSSDVDAGTSSVPARYFEIEAGDDARAAEIMLGELGGRLKNCRGRFFVRKPESVVFEEGEDMVKNEIINMTKSNVVIMAVQMGKVLHYSKSTAKLSACMKRILADESIVDGNFVDSLWRSNLQHIAFTDGVYSFRERRLMPLAEALNKQVFFTQDTRRPFPAASPELDRAKQELMARVLVPTFPDADVRAFFLNCLARALAGEIPDKRWFACLGPRNCGKSILCKLLKLAFGPFVRAMNAENLILRESSQDAAKAQSWMKPLEHTRVAYSNEMRASGATRDKTLDGELIKRLCSNGDEVELRTNHQDEIQVRLQATMFLFANDFPAIDPPDAYQTMVGFTFLTEFRDAHEMTDPADPCQKHWRPKDHEIDAFIQQPVVLDAFTMLLIEHYTSSIQTPPAVVQTDTASIRGPAAESQEERLKRLVRYSGAPDDVVFYKEIRLTAEAAGMGRLSDAKIEAYVRALYGIQAMRPSKFVDGRKVQDRGFKGLVLCDAGFDERAERVRRAEAVRQNVRARVVTSDHFTPDARVGK